MAQATVEEKWVLGIEHEYLITRWSDGHFRSEFIPIDDSKPTQLAEGTWFEAVRAVFKHMSDEHYRLLKTVELVSARKQDELIEALAHVANYNQETLVRRNDEYDRQRPIRYARSELERLGYGYKLK